MKWVCLLVGLFWVQAVSADEAVRKKLTAALVAGSPWSFSNIHVSEIEHWRIAADGSLEYMSSDSPNVWSKQTFTAEDTIVRSSRAGGNTITYYLDKDGKARAAHSKNPSLFESIRSK